MNRKEYMDRLEQLLLVLPIEEREEALQYYEDYFEDAGIPANGLVGLELGAPEEVAAKIAELKDVYKKSPEAIKSLKDPNVKMDIKNRMIIEKTLDYLVKTNS